MKTYIALLRGINVSGKNMIKMNELITHLSELKYRNIRTYIQSGNVIFESSEKDYESHQEKIYDKILEKTGFKVPVIVKGVESLRKIMENNPFVNSKMLDINKLHVTFLDKEPLKENIVELVETKITEDEFILTNSVIYLCCQNGYGKTKLNNNFFEKKLKVLTTTRNWKTVVKLIEISEFK